MTAYNPPSSIFFNGVTFNPDIIEQGDTISGGGIGDVTLAGNNTFTGLNSFTNVAGITTPAINGTGIFLDVGTTMNDVNIGNPTSTTTIKNLTNLEFVDIAIELDVNTIDTGTVSAISIGPVNANQILLGSVGNDIPVTIPGTMNVYIDELVVDQDSGKKYVAVDACYFTNGTGSQATMDTKTAVPLHIAPSIAVEPNAICTEVVIGNSTIPVTIEATTITLTGNANVATQTPGNSTTLAASTAFVSNAVSAAVGVSLSANNVFTGANSFTGGSITMTTQAAANNTTFGATTAFVTGAITTLLAAANTWSGANSFTTGSINVTTQTSGNNTTLAASTAFVTAAITAILSTANTFTANQIFPTIQFSTGSLNQQFRIQHVTAYPFGGVTAGAIVNNTFSYATLGLTNFTTFICATVSNGSTAANGARVIFSLSATSASSFTVTGMNPTATNTAASAFSIVVYGR